MNPSSPVLDAVQSEAPADSPFAATGNYLMLDGEQYFQIENSHLMPEFFMSLVGSSDHWMFVSSSGALTAGRCDPDSALFPYAADDQVSVASSDTGSYTIIRVGDQLWQPFSSSANDESIRRNLYKTPLGNKLVFEEIHDDLQLSFRYRWAFSEEFGFVRSCKLCNLGSEPVELQLLDGLRNLLPYGVSSEFMMRFSNLANAYKKSELLPESGVGLYYLSSIPTDRAEPSEGLKATVAWQLGLEPEATLLSPEQIPRFLQLESNLDGFCIENEVDVRGKAGAYLCYQTMEIAAGDNREWQIMADLAQDHA
ncbi:MAG: hypothetical protein AAF483_15340, partial [Planctomycetota bacterium]